MTTGFALLDNGNVYRQYMATRRNGRKVTGAIILHDAEGGTDLTGEDMGAENVLRYLLTRTTPGSYHTLVDRDTTIRCAPYDYEVWHDTTSNNYAVGLSVAWNKADLLRMTYAQRAAYYKPLVKATLHAAEWFRTVKGIRVPLDRFLSRAEIVAGKPGLSTHSRMDPTRRSDPFGTGSVFETEFLAVLRNAATPPAPVVPAPPPPPPPPKEIDMTPEALLATRIPVSWGTVTVAEALAAAAEIVEARTATGPVRLDELVARIDAKLDALAEALAAADVIPIEVKE